MGGNLCRKGVRGGAGGCAGRDGELCGTGVFWMGALRPLRWDSGDAPSFSRGMGRSSRVGSDSSRTSRNMEPTRLDRRRAAEPMRGTSPRPRGGDSGAHWTGTMSGLFSRMFHVKQGKTVLLATSRFQLPTPHFVLYSIAYLRSPPFSMNRPMPMATESMGDLATIVRMPVTREINRSMPARSAPPPESMMPVS